MIDLDAEAMKKAAFAVFAKANEKHLSQDKIEALWPSQHHPHWNGLAEAAVRSYMKEPWTRDDLAKGLAMLDGIVLQEIKSTVGDPSDANNWREYLGRADDLLAHLSASCAPLQAPIPPAGSDAGEEQPVAWRYRWKLDGEWTSWRVADHSQKSHHLRDLEEVPLFAREAAAVAAQSPTIGEITDEMVERAARAAFDAWWNNRGAGAETSWLSTRTSWLRQQRAALSAAALTRLPDAGWRSMDSAPKGCVTENAGCRGESEWFLARPAKKYRKASASPMVVIRRRPWPHDADWSDNGETFYISDYFDGWMPLPDVLDISFGNLRASSLLGRVNANLLSALTALRNAVKSEPSMQGREYVDLGIKVNAAIEEAERFPAVADADTERKAKAFDACRWYWPEDDTSNECCAESPQEVVQNDYEWSSKKAGRVVAVARGGVVEVTYCASLPPAADADSDDDFWVEEPTSEAAQAKIDAEKARRALLPTRCRTRGGSDVDHPRSENVAGVFSRRLARRQEL